MIDDTELLRRYALERAEEPFAELVRRHITVVYATARRECRGHEADVQDVTQVVFTALARADPASAGASDGEAGGRDAAQTRRREASHYSPDEKCPPHG